MLARRTCQRVVDKPSLACTALLATVYRSFFNNFLLYIYTHSQGNDARPFSNRKRLIETPYIYVSSPLHSFARIFLHLPKQDSSKSLLLPIIYHNISTNCEFFYLRITSPDLSLFITFLIIEIEIPRVFSTWKIPFFTPSITAGKLAKILGRKGKERGGGKIRRGSKWAMNKWHAIVTVAGIVVVGN